MSKYQYKPRHFKQKKGTMATIPVKDKNKMKSLMIFFLKKRETAKSISKKNLAYRNYMILLLGFNTAFRAEDLLQLKVEDLMNGYVSIVEFKKKKQQTFPLKKTLFQEIKNYIDYFHLTKYDYLFFKNNPGSEKPITRQRLDKILSECARDVNLRQPFSAHSLRKTFAYQKYVETKDIYLVMRMLAHEDPLTTLTYICWYSNESEKEREKTHYSGLSKI